MIRTLLATLLFNSPAAADPPPVCTGGDRAERRLTCVYDGDGGWERGVKWRLLEIDAPEISARDAGCAAERAIGLDARDRLRDLMGAGYVIEGLPSDMGMPITTALGIPRAPRKDRSGRALVRVRLADGRDAGAVLMAEGLAQSWPNRGNVWCGR